jgi:hypothetical protein
MNNWNTPLTNFQTVQLFWSMTQRRYVIRASLLAARNAIAFTLQPASKKSVCIVTLVLAKWRRNRFPVGSRGQTASNGQSPWARSGQETKQTTHLHFVPRLGIGGVHFRSRHVRNWHNAAYQSAKFFFFCNNTEASRDGLKRRVFTYLPAGAEIILWDVTPCRLSKTTRRHNSTLTLGQNFLK